VSEASIDRIASSPAMTRRRVRRLRRQLPWLFSLGPSSTIDRWIARWANLNRIARSLAFRNSPFGECRCGARL
jgi:hypothetical protein